MYSLYFTFTLLQESRIHQMMLFQIQLLPGPIYLFFVAHHRDLHQVLKKIHDDPLTFHPCNSRNKEDVIVVSICSTQTTIYHRFPHVLILFYHYQWKICHLQNDARLFRNSDNLIYIYKWMKKLHVLYISLLYLIHSTFPITCEYLGGLEIRIISANK